MEMKKQNLIQLYFRTEELDSLTDFFSNFSSSLTLEEFGDFLIELEKMGLYLISRRLYRQHVAYNPEDKDYLMSVINDESDMSGACGTNER